MKATPPPDRPIFIVSGYMRSGTSMMMKALISGGMAAAYEPSRDSMNEDWGDDSYRPNEGGFYEMASETYRHPDFPLPFRGRLIKALIGGVGRLPVARYQIVMMVRDPEEIRQSYQAFFGRACPAINGKPFSEKTYFEAIDWHASQLANRRDTTLTVLRYRSVVESPCTAFLQLVSDGWPIKGISAASVVDPEKCRFKLEELEVGI